MKHYDVAVIGAGPAGGFFARELSEREPKLRILVIDGQTEANKKPCGGLLAPDAQKLLAEMNLTLPNSILADPQIFTVETVDLGSGLMRSYQRHYLNMDRYRFDRWVLSMLPRKVSVVADRVKAIRREGGGFLLTLSGETVSAASVVGADGSASLVRRFLGRRSPLQYVSIQEWYPDVGQSAPYYSCIFDPQTSDSCSWTIRKDGYVIYGGAFAQKGCREAFSRQKARLEAFLGSSLGAPVRREACLVSSPRRPRDFDCGEAGIYLIGEAAGFISASSFEGISNAILSARSLADAYHEGKTHERILRCYRRGTRSQRVRLMLKAAKRAVLCSPLLRRIIMASGITSVKQMERVAKGTSTYPSELKDI